MRTREPSEESTAGSSSFMKQRGRIIAVTLHKTSDLTPVSDTGSRCPERAEESQGETTEEDQESAIEKALAGFDFVCCADNLLIMKAAAGGLENYNRDSDGDARVYPGDYIVSVNGKTNPVRMSSELKDEDGETWELKVERAPGSGQTFIDGGLVGTPTNGEMAAFEEQQPLAVEEPPAQALGYASPHNTTSLGVEMPDPHEYVELTFKTLALDDVRPTAFEAILRDKLVIMGMGIYEMRDMTVTIADGLSVQLRGTHATIKHLKNMQLTKLEIMGCKAEEVPQRMMEEESLHASAPGPPTKSLLDEAAQVVMKVREREEHWESTEDVPPEGRPRQQTPHMPMSACQLLERAARRTPPTPSPPQEAQEPARAPVVPRLVLPGTFPEADLGHHHVAAQSAAQKAEVAESTRRRREDEAKYQLHLEQANKEAVGFIERASELIDQLQTPREDAFLTGTGDGGTGEAGELLLRPGVGGPEEETEKEPPPGMQGRDHPWKNCDRACDGVGVSCTVQ
mmetsp:Transcript_90597/g.230505  ORF Transcript_90597/g.230505 Transcript_90597/m.230505 type:complete len:512 (-) Transcript_90597:43-1578(-)